MTLAEICQVLIKLKCGKADLIQKNGQRVHHYISKHFQFKFNKIQSQPYQTTMKFITFAAAIILATDAVTVKMQNQSAEFKDLTLEEFAANLGVANPDIVMPIFHAIDTNDDNIITSEEYNAYIGLF